MPALEFIFWLYVAVSIHELGHFMVAYTLRQPISKMEVGIGPMLCSTSWKGMNFVFRLVPFSGFVSLCWLSSKKWKNFAVFSAGPIANFFTAGVLYLTSHADNDLFGLSMWIAVGNLIPFTTKLFDSDGRQLINEWRRDRRKTCRPAV